MGAGRCTPSRWRYFRLHLSSPSPPHGSHREVGRHVPGLLVDAELNIFDACVESLSSSTLLVDFQVSSRALGRSFTGMSPRITPSELTQVVDLHSC